MQHTGAVKQDRNHIVSAGYIRNWAVDEVVECELVTDGRRRSLAPSHVGVRKKFYAGSPGPDGTRRAAPAERARHAVETEALPLLRELPIRWPLRDSGERAWIALWLAMILCTSPRRRQQLPDMVARFYAYLDREAPEFAQLTADQRHELCEADFELDSMFEDVSTAASLLGQMHWTLLQFTSPSLVSSDHPISTTLWTRDKTRSSSEPPALLLASLEVRVPIGPTAALLLTWVDADDRADAVPASQTLLAAFNRGAWCQAERHRFWRPGTTPSDIDDRRPVPPISAELFDGYEPKSSARLDAAFAWLSNACLVT